MSAKAKKIVAAILLFLSLLFGSYVAMTDGDPTTNPDVDAVIDSGKDVYDAFQDAEDLSSESEAAAPDS